MTAKRAELRIVIMPGRMGGQPTVGDSRLEAAEMAITVWQGTIQVEDWVHGWRLHPDQVLDLLGETA